MTDMTDQTPARVHTAARVHAGMSDQPLSVDEAYGFVLDPSAGAVVLFSGTVRDHSEGRDVAGLSYESYTERAEVQLRELSVRVVRKWPDLCAVWMAHRVGELAISETAVIVAVSAPHRPTAFDAASWAIQTLKDEVAIWKQEHWSDGAAHWPGTD